MLKSMTALQKLGFSRLTACDWQLSGLAGFNDGSDGAIITAIPLLRFHLGVWCVRRLATLAEGLFNKKQLQFD